MPIDCLVDLRRGPTGDWKRTSATNISMSGMFLRTTEMHPTGSSLDVKFELHNGRPAIRARVEVLWNRGRDTGPEAPQGLGVRFLDLDLESKYAISRLVDRYQQLGRMPFHLAAPEDEPPAGGRGAWGRGALVLAFLAGTVAGAAGFWLLARPGPGTDTGATNMAQASELTPKAPPHPNPLPQGERGPESSELAPKAPPENQTELTGSFAAMPADAAPADPTIAIESAVEVWARAWATKDVERYLTAYSIDFSPASGLSRDAWETQRRQRFARPGAVEVSLSALQVEILGPDRALARFDQAYAAPGYRDRVRKQLELRRREQEWKIEREEIQTKLAVE